MGLLKPLSPLFLICWLTFFSVAFAGEATTATTKDVNFSGWKPVGKEESLSTSEFAEKFPDIMKTNETDSETAETRKSYVLVYPPRAQSSHEQQNADQKNNQARNSGPALRAYPTQTRYQRMMSFAASEGGHRRAPGVYQRPEFPPVANPPPLPPHARRPQNKPLPNFKSESTSQHQVQIQLLDGYLVPPAGGVQNQNIRGKDKNAPLATFPLNLNNIPEIRLLLPGDIHQQLTNSRQPGAQQNQVSKPYPEAPNRGAPNHGNLPYHNGDSKIPSPAFESQRYSDKNFDQIHKQQDGPPKPNFNQNNQQSENGYSQPDLNNFGNSVSFPAHPNFQEATNNYGQTSFANGPIGNEGIQNQNFQLDNRDPPKNHNYNNDDRPRNLGNTNQEQYNHNFQLDARAPAKTQSFSSGSGETYAQNGNNYQGNEGQQFNSQAGAFPAFVNEQQRGPRGESFRPLMNGNFQQNTNYNGIQSVKGGQQLGNNQYGINHNLGQNAWRAQQSNRGNNQGVLTPDKQNFYNVNAGNGNQNIKTQSGFQHTQQTLNFNYAGLDQAGKKVTSTTYNQGNSFQGTITQQKILGENDLFDGKQPDGNQASTTQTTQQVLGGRNDNQGNITDDVYFVPQIPTQEDVQTQITDFDVSTTDDSSLGTETISTNTVKDNTPFTQETEFETSSDRLAGGSGTGEQVSNLVDRNGFCDCSQNCAPIQRLPSENFGSSIREIARSLNADAFFEFIGLSDDEIETMLSNTGSYTLFIPSNEAVSRLPSNLIDHWRENNPDFTMALLNHVIPDSVSLSQLKLGGRLTSRANDATIFVNNYNNEAVTVNGHRIIHGDVTAPKGGLIHVIDGTLCPVADQDAISTLRTCNKYDGFLTLADVTKLLEMMQDDGPYTIFLPSNEALTKIPSEELSVLKENITLLREFLDYHIVQGAYFSGDLKDGQYLTTLHERKPIRVGVRVDGCYRRLVEANNSPLFKADIPTKNGVIHVLDWILRPGDLNWCEGVILP